MTMSKAAVLEAMRRATARAKDRQVVASTKERLARARRRHEAMRSMPRGLNLLSASHGLAGALREDAIRLQRRLAADWIADVLLNVPDDDRDIEVTLTARAESAVKARLT